MPAPSPSWQTVRVFGTWRNTLDGTLKPGTYRDTVPVRLISAADDSIFPPGVAADGVLNTSPVDTDPNDTYADGPSLDLQLPATDDPDIAGESWFHTLVVDFAGGGRETYVFAVSLQQAANGIDLLNIAPQETILADSVYGGTPATGYPIVSGGTP